MKAHLSVLEDAELGRNGRTKQIENIVETVMDELESRSQAGARGAATAVKEANVGAKVDRILDFIEQNATVIAEVGKRVAAETIKDAPEVAAVVGEALGEAAGAGLEVAGDIMETLGEEVIKPTVRYGKGLRHGILIGAAVAMLYTPWPGKVLREKLMAMVKEALDLAQALRESAAEPSGTA